MALGDVNRVWLDRLNQRLRPLGLSASRWRALLYVSRMPGRLTQTELARMMAVEAPTLARLVKQMEQEGWLRRRPQPGDARCKLLYPTAKARKALLQINAAVDQLREQTVGQLSAAQAAAGLEAVLALQKLLERA